MNNMGRLLILYLCLVTVNIYLLSKPDLASLASQPYRSLSQIISLTGTTLLCLSFVLAGRFRFIENLFGGMDKMYKTHHAVSGIAFVLLINHPILLILQSLPNRAAAMTYIIPGTNLSYTFGICALSLMISLLIITLYIDLPYHIWKKTHEYFGLVLILASVHIFLISSDVSRYLPLRFYMLTLIALGLISYLYKRFVYGRFGPRYLYTIADMKKYRDVMELTLSPRSKKMIYTPGQFAFLSVANAAISHEEHPFSIMSNPDDPYVRFAIKIVGDYTIQVQNVPVGSTIVLTGPFGQFGTGFFANKPIICIAGGIGITPFLSLLSSEANKEIKTRPVHLVYTTKTDEDALYQTELSDLVQHNEHVHYTHHVSKLSGRLTASRIEELTTDVNNALIFLCGPPRMMEDLVRQFIEKGVKKHNIKYEDFSLK
jgi:predicted ferric reductase